MTTETKTKEKKEAAPPLPQDGTPPAGNAIAPTNGALTTYEFGDYEGAGGEDQRIEEQKIPIVRVLQSNSPQCKPPSGGGLPGARQGMLFNTATQEMWAADETPLPFYPVSRDYQFIEYVPRDSGGGFVGIHSPDSELVKELRKKQGKFGKLTTGDGNDLIETFSLYALIVPQPYLVERVMVSFTSTQIGKYQNFISRYNTIKYPSRTKKNPDDTPMMILPPLWAHQWLLGTVAQSNAKGDFWGYTLRLAKEPPVQSLMRLDDPLYLQAGKFYEQIKAGRVVADHDGAAKTVGGDAASDDVPF